MLELLRDLLTLLLLAGGVFLGLSGVVGMLRLPDFYTRVHAAGVTDTLSAGLLIGALVLQAGFSLISLKLLFILFFLWLTSPVASHALARAAWLTGLRPAATDEGEPPSSTASNT